MAKKACESKERVKKKNEVTALSFIDIGAGVPKGLKEMEGT
jgi:hypothetical protein